MTDIGFIVKNCTNSMLAFLMTLFLWVSIGCNYHDHIKADLIIHNANILTIDNNFSKAKTMAIKNGEIIYIGNDKHINLWRDSLTQVIDVRGKTILPGFVEPHTHPIASAVLYNWIDVSGFTHGTAKRALKHLKRQIKEVPKGEWVLAFGWDMLKLKGATSLTKEYINENITDDHPVWIMTQAMHTHYFNSMALDLAGISDDTPDPVGGGYYAKNNDGELTGMTKESATVQPIVSLLPQADYQRSYLDIEKMYRRYNSAGITSIGATEIIGLMPGIDPLEVCKYLADNDPLILRLFYYDVGVGRVYQNNIGLANDRIGKLGQKYWVDGSPYTGSMLMYEPYLDSPINNKLGIAKGEYGHSMFQSPMYLRLFKPTIDSNYQLSIHTQGDSAVQIALDNLEMIKMLGSNLNQGRHRLEHLSLVTEAQLSRMKSLEVSPSFHINHIYYYGDSLSNSIIGPERANRIMPLKVALKKGHRISLHNDSPMYRPNPLLAVRTATTRLTDSGRQLGSDQAIDLKSALRAITIDAAWQLHMEDKIGSLETGKKADFVILDKDPFEVYAEDVHELKILATFVDGYKVY